MAIDPSVAYPGQIDTTDTVGYPHGKAKNVTTSGAGDGTPLEKGWVNDFLGFVQAMLRRGLKSPSGTPEKVEASQVLDVIDQYGFAPNAAAAAAFNTERVVFNGSGATPNLGMNFWYISEIAKWIAITDVAGQLHCWTSDNGVTWGASDTTMTGGQTSLSNPVWDGATGWRILGGSKLMYASSDGEASSLVLHSTMPATATPYNTGNDPNGLVRSESDGRYCAIGHQVTGLAPRAFHLPDASTTWLESTINGTYTAQHTADSIAVDVNGDMGMLLADIGGADSRYLFSTDGGQIWNQVESAGGAGIEVRDLSYSRAAGAFVAREKSGATSTTPMYASVDMNNWYDQSQDMTDVWHAEDQSFVWAQDVRDLRSFTESESFGLTNVFLHQSPAAKTPFAVNDGLGSGLQSTGGGGRINVPDSGGTAFFSMLY